MNKFINKISKGELNDYNKIYGIVYDTNIENYNEFLVDSSLIVGDKIDVFKLLENNDILGERQYNISFEYRYELNDYYLITNISNDSNELVVKLNGENNRYWNEVIENIKNNEYNKALYIQLRNSTSRYFIFDISYSMQGDLIFRTQSPVEDFTEGDEVKIYELVGDTEVEEYILIERDVSRPTVVLKNYKTDNLSNFDYEKINKSSSYKKYGDIEDNYQDLSDEDKVKHSIDIKHDYSNFEDHVRFGSAITKVTNLKEKYKDYVDGKLKNIEESMTEFEKFYFLKLEEENFTYQEVEDYLDNMHDKALEYDAFNHESLIQNIEPTFLEEDKYGYLTNLISMMGEFFDNIWIKTESVLRLNNYSFDETIGTPTDIVKELLEELGFEPSVSFSNENFLTYYQNEDNLSKISNIISKRFLYNLSNMYKSKGTKDVIYSILNIFGIQRDLLEIIEFGGFRSENEDRVYFEELDWILKLLSNSYLSVNITNSDIDLNSHSIELIIRKFDDSGTLFTFGNNDIKYTKDNDNVNLTFSINDVTVNSISIPDNSLWSIISLKKNNNQITLYGAQRSINGGKIIHSDIDTNEGTYESFSSMEIGDGGIFDITEFRVFESELSKSETDRHLLDIRSISEDKDTPTKLFRYKVYRSIDDITNDFVLSFSNVNLTDFYQGIFENYSVIPNFFDIHFSTEKIRSVDRFIKNKKLNKDDKVSKLEGDTKFIDSDKLGIYISLNSLLDKDLIRIIKTTDDLVPDDLETETFTLNELQINKKYYEHLDYLYNDLNKLYTLWKLINRKVFNTLQEFIPVGLDLSVGILIRNNILNKNRAYRTKNKGILDKGFRSNIIIKPKEVERIQNARVDLLFDPVKITTSKQTEIIHYEEREFLQERNNDSLYLINIESDVKVSPWTKFMTKGYSIMSYDFVDNFNQDPIRVEENQSGMIKVTHGN